MKTKMVNLKLPKPDKKDKTKNLCCAPDNYEPPKYPYGLLIRLDSDAMKKLNIKASDFKAGDKVQVEAEAYIHETRQVESINDTKSSGLEIQITDLALSGGDFESGWNSSKDGEGEDNADGD